MAYVDGFVIPVPTAHRQKFITHARICDRIFMELGATRIVECWGDDVPDGKRTDFRRAVEATGEETVCFSWIEWPSKTVRDAAMAKARELMETDPRLNPAINPMPFDGARMIFGGFMPALILDAPPANKAGDHIWYELLTADANAAQAFYGPILGWTFVDSGQPAMDYRIISAGPHSIGGLMGITPEMAAHGARPAWVGYVAVTDVDATVSAVEERGGRVLMPAMDIPGVGRIAMITDPQGAPFYIMTGQGRGKSLAFADDAPRPGHCAWNELVTSDQSAAWDFYGALFGWEPAGAMDLGPMGSYQFVAHGGVIGAMMKGVPEMGPPHWNYYFRVENIDDAVAAIAAGGGQVIHGPQEIPGGEFTLNGIDPQGAHFALVGPRA